MSDIAYCSFSELTWWWLHDDVEHCSKLFGIFLYLFSALLTLTIMGRVQESDKSIDYLGLIISSESIAFCLLPLEAISSKKNGLRLESHEIWLKLSSHFMEQWNFDSFHSTCIFHGWPKKIENSEHKLLIKTFKRHCYCVYSSCKYHWLDSNIYFANFTEGSFNYDLF